MEMPKPSEDDKAFFRSILSGDPEVEIKPMFGNLGAFVNGNMFAGLFGSSVGVRLLDSASTQELLRRRRRRAVRAGRASDGWATSASHQGMDPDLAAQWVEKARVHVGSLPPKVKKPAKKRT